MKLLFWQFWGRKNCRKVKIAIELMCFQKTMSQKTILNPTIDEMRANYEPTLEMKKSAFYYEESEMTQSLIVLIDNMNASKYVVQNFILWFQALLSLLPVKLTLFNVGLTTVVLVVIMPQTITYILIYPLFRLIFGTLYPAYCSYKAVRSRDVKQYVSFNNFFFIFLFKQIWYKKFLKNVDLLGWLFLGEMDDVLDRFCFVPSSGDVHGCLL